MSAQPIIMVLDADLAAPDLLLSELHERYGGDYDVIVQHTAQDVQRTLEASRRRVAGSRSCWLSDQSMSTPAS